MPMVLLFIVGSIEYTLFPSESNKMFPAIFIMGFILYCVLAVVGLILGVVLPDSLNNKMRFLISFLVLISANQEGDRFQSSGEQSSPLRSAV
jgi:hypothetical protein